MIHFTETCHTDISAKFYQQGKVSFLSWYDLYSFYLNEIPS